MPRDLPLGNGTLLVAFDKTYQIRDLYWPHVGLENHAMGHTFRVGIWSEGSFKWLDDSEWERHLTYERPDLVTQVGLKHPALEVQLSIQDAVDFHESLLVRRFELTNLADHARELRLFLHHDFHISGNEVGDTAYYEPDRRAVLHYKRDRWFLINGALQVGPDEPGPGWAATDDTAPGMVVGLHQWACGLKEIRNLQGTWRDAEDGQLSGEVVAHGSVDSCVGFNMVVPSQAKRTVYAWLAIGPDFPAVALLNRLVRQRGPQSFIERTRGYWALWLNSHLPEFNDLPDRIRDTYQTSLTIIRTQVDEGGAVIAANDSDVSSDVRDTYSYMWPRDGALVTSALVDAGYIDIPRSFFKFCSRALSPEGYLLHKYNPDGTLASSWHPWIRNGHKDIPLQEDETALVLWSLWRHFDNHHDVEFIKPLYRPMIMRAADFLVRFRDEKSGLPLPSYDLWEERHGVHAWTVAATWAGLDAAARFAEAFGDAQGADRYRRIGESIRQAATDHLWREDLGHFLRRIEPADDGTWQADESLDASLAGIWKFGLFEADDPRVVATMRAIENTLRVQTDVGGMARYVDDRYHQVSQDVEHVPGNPWFICTLWMSEYRSLTAHAKADLTSALDLLTWASDRALPSGILAEQVNPYDGSPLSVSPLTWSHAEFVTAVHLYLDAWRRVT
ncbi:MAG: glycoside hydrolase family 15 protein [Anaerolineales bacterium]|jgi:GH15 family glucan-1,4-alpha-glucosidase